MLFLGVGDGIAWQGTFRGPRQTGDGYNAGGKKKEHPRMDAPSVRQYARDGALQVTYGTSAVV